MHDAAVKAPADAAADDAGGEDAGNTHAGNTHAGSTGTGNADAGPPKAGCTRCGSCEAVVTVTSANHVVGTVHYDSLPPAGGDHNACWATWGVHTKPLAQERWVHNLEHGGVVFLYNCPSGCSAEVAQLTGFVKGHTRTILASDTDMPTQFAAVAWGERLKSACLDLTAFAAFYNAHVDRAPESIPDNPPMGCPPD